jgi:predicted TPR repeat methyltransferase
MSQFTPIASTDLKEIVAAARARDSEFASRIPPEYFSPILPIRLVFWQRLRVLYRLIRRHAPSATTCLDFGGGGGVFAPTLAAHFKEPALLDLSTREADLVKTRLGLDHLELIEADATTVDLGQRRFQVIVAADVLEHFKELDDAAEPIHRWLADDGVLVTSLPTETRIYEFLRFVFRTEKPHDHYHRAVEVEDFLSRNGFVRRERRYVPLGLPLFPLYYVSAWQKASREGRS